MSTQDIQQLRSETGAGIMDIKKALEEAGGDLEGARDILRKRGAATAAKKGERETHEGLVVSYIHPGGKVGVLLKLYCETDFVARTDDFQQLAADIAMHIAAMSPQYVSREAVPADVVEKEKEVYAEQVAGEGKPADITEKIVEGKLEKFYAENVLPEQSFVKDSDKTVKERIEEAIATLGENIQIGDFVRFEL